MSEEARLLSALKESGIQRIAVVDDAFELPEVPEGDWGKIFAYLQQADVRQAISLRAELAPLYTAALEAIQGTDYDNDHLVQFNRLLFDAYIETDDAKFDPNRHFSRTRGSSLKSVRPILELLKKASPVVHVVRIGSLHDDDFSDRIAGIDLVFADFFLDPAVGADESPDDNASTAAKRKSQEVIQTIINARGKAPSIILMSSKDVAARANEFRRDLGANPGRVAAARFQFIEKNHLTIDASGSISVQEKASDTLLDILQTFRFGEGISLAVELWKESAHAAIQSTASAISELELRDFAYLIRFRLEKEGQELVEYMEWLLGEYLLDETAHNFYAKVQEQPSVREVAKTQASVEGAFDGQTQTVAQIYHRVRVEDVRPGRAPSIRMGDLFLSSDGQRISAVLTPDCDLVVRENRRGAKRLTLVNGTIKPFDRKNTVAADFIMIDGAAKNIEWSKKNIETQEFDWAATPDTARRQLGTLRPMYAQQLQRVVLHDLGRVGLAPWPALYVDTEVELWYINEKNERKVLPFASGVAKTCIVMPKRPDAKDEKHQVVFTRTLIRKVKELLKALPEVSVATEGVQHLKSLVDGEQDEQLFREACGGVALEAHLPYQILVTQSDQQKVRNWVWLHVRVS
jgi:hypothetical protein